MRPTRVLIVDDEQSLSDLIARVVGAAGNVPVPVPTVQDALAQIGDGDVDLVVADLGLPGLGGLELLAALSARGDAPPVLVISGSDDERLEDAARLLGARAVVREPFGFRELRGAIDEVLESSLATAA